jgi:hypothetical protein
MGSEYAEVPNENYANMLDLQRGPVTQTQERDLELSYRNNLLPDNAPCANQLYPGGAVYQGMNHPYNANLIYPQFEQPPAIEVPGDYLAGSTMAPPPQTSAMDMRPRPARPVNLTGPVRPGWTPPTVTDMTLEGAVKIGLVVLTLQLVLVFFATGWKRVLR